MFLSLTLCLPVTCLASAYLLGGILRCATAFMWALLPFFPYVSIEKSEVPVSKGSVSLPPGSLAPVRAAAGRARQPGQQPAGTERNQGPAGEHQDRRMPSELHVLCHVQLLTWSLPSWQNSCHFGLVSEPRSRAIVSAHVLLMPSVSSAEHPIKHREKAINTGFLLMLKYHGESLLPLCTQSQSSHNAECFTTLLRRSVT